MAVRRLTSLMFRERKVELEDHCTIRQVSNPRISPDGRSIAFSVTDTHCMENRYVTQVYITGLDTEPRQLTREGTNNRNPIWSPSGTDILFLSNLDGQQGLWRLAPDRAMPRKIVSSADGISLPSWSPDSKRILFLARVPQGELQQSDVLVIRRLPYKSNGLGFLGNRWNHIFFVEAEGGKTTQVTEGEFDVSAATWSPNGDSIAYIANKTEEASFTDRNDIWITDLKNGIHEKITDGSRAFRSLSYSPNGKSLAAIGNTEKYGLATKNDIHVMNLGSREEINLTEGFHLKVGDRVNGGTGTGTDPSPCWTNDSKAVFFLTAAAGNENLYKVSLDTKEVELASETTRTIQSYSFSEDQTAMAFLATDIVSPSEIWVTVRGQTRRVTGFNDELIGKVQLSKGEKFTFKASDGVPVDGWLYRPVGHEGEKSPMVLILKGGPHSSSYGNAFSFEAQVLAANGFAVLYTNERGSGGYGEEFARTARARFYGEKDFSDLMETIDFVVKRFPVDEKKLGVKGYSRGGFLTNWIITHTDRFKAAITAGGFCDVYSFFGTADNIHIWCEKNYQGTPWDDEELYMSKSPIRYVKNVVTPTLIIHAIQDLRAPVSQAEQLYVSLKRLGKETELVLFPGENHGLPRASTPRHMVEYHQHVLRWFNKYLK